jgi:ribonuclease BN (tRNA processing enzyme)
LGQENLMTRRFCFAAAVFALALAGAAPTAASDACRAAPVGLQVLGSGGPIAEGSRAGTSYLLWIGGEPRVLIDAGPGSFIRFGEAGAKVAPLRGILFTHIHGDHAGGLPGILNSGSFETGTDPLPVIGPDGNDWLPSTGAYLRGLFDGRSGAFAYLKGFLDGSDGRRMLSVREIATATGDSAPQQFDDLMPGLRVTAIPVHHGENPALGYRIRFGDADIIFAGDQSALSSQFEALLAGSKPDLLVVHHAIPEGEGQPRGLHRPPASLGTLAATIAPARLILSHNMKRATDRLAEGLAAIRASYGGPVDVAADLDCFIPAS